MLSYLNDAIQCLEGIIKENKAPNLNALYLGCALQEVRCAEAYFETYLKALSAPSGDI